MCKTVLVADDETANRLFLKKLILRSGFEVIEARTGREAVEIFSTRKGELCLVLMDLSMPVMDGLEATEAIRELDPEVPILALTAYTGPEDREACLRAGMNGLVPEPLEIDCLKETLQRYMPST